MATVGMAASCLLSGLLAKLTRDYFSQSGEGVPAFDSADYSELAGKNDQKIRGEQPRSLPGEEGGVAAYVLG
ncbi:hypothetical protein SBP02_09110 [Pseudomonas benzenivorans]|uniref:Uncharacterized protein n=1 Tax=Pseudomonas benzenivorans TaxID=556533 RepID=A0ABZ0Q0A0_9PSED|nr:hypothetical protein [Pseudomonas benzenivorans]WPC06888.1 hypothetical protein SBP02_09110 [Pseudomonas benzenivorans]